jgi:2-polyprenyl-3-methyl-5-hydroxy-6-metoxy-1,4-benzoquinol methylase
MENHILSDEQRLTITTYDQTVDLYMTRQDLTIAGQTYIDWIDTALERIRKESAILEIGSGYGRDADRLESNGYNVHRTDVSESFIQYQESQGKKVDRFNPILEIMSARYDLALANGVFLHFPPAELKLAFQNLHESLKDNGMVVFSTKIGDGWEGLVYHHLIQPRYEKFWKIEELKKLILECRFKILEMDSDDKWTRVTVQKEN